jgi:hypothetical protein
VAIISPSLVRISKKASWHKFQKDGFIMDLIAKSHVHLRDLNDWLFTSQDRQGLTEWNSKLARFHLPEGQGVMANK